jgi:hypothetical protein
MIARKVRSTKSPRSPSARKPRKPKSVVLTQMLIGYCPDCDHSNIVEGQSIHPGDNFACEKCGCLCVVNRVEAHPHGRPVVVESSPPRRKAG